MDTDGVIIVWNWTSKSPLKIVKGIDTQITTLNTFSNKDGFIIGNRLGHLNLYSIVYKDKRFDIQMEN